MPTRNIIIAPCGNSASVFQTAWLKEKRIKNFELCLLFYHEKVNQPDLYKDADHFFHLTGFKYHMIHRLLTEIHPEWLKQYDQFLFLDDDIEIDTIQINRLFSLSKALDSSISCASLTHDSYCSWPIFKQKQNSFCRFVGQIEVMAPLFNAPTLEKCLPSFIANRSSWGMDSVWPKILDYPEDKLVVFDTVTMRHIHPVGQGELYKKIATDPHKEWEDITRQYGAKKHNYQEYGRLQLVDKNHNRLSYFIHQCQQFFAFKKQAWNDYDLPSRVRSKTGKIFKKSGSLQHKGS